MSRAGDDMPRDAHLRAALRHAPDAAVQPPPHLSAQILAAAHRAAAAPAPVTATPARSRWLAWPRWPTQGALAGLCVVGLVGLLWRGEAPGPAVEAERAPMAAPSAEAPAATTPGSAPMPALAPAAPPAPAPALAAAPAPAPAQADLAEAKRGPATAAAVPQDARMPAAPRRASVQPSPALPPVPRAEVRAEVHEGLPAVAALDTPAPSAARVASAAAAPMAKAPSVPLLHGLAPSAPIAPAPATAPAVPAAPTAWRVDGEDRGSPPPAWLLALQQIDAQRGQPSLLQALADTPRVDLFLPGGQPAGSVWIGSELLLWCRPSGCRLSSLDADSAAQLLQPLPPLKTPR